MTMLFNFMMTDRDNFKKYCSIIGAHFVIAPWSFMWLYGNLSAYMDSYFRFKCYPKCLDSDSQWILGLYVAGQVPATFLVRPLLKRIGLKYTGIISMIIGNLALLGSAWSLQISVARTATIFALFIGPWVGITGVVAIGLVSGWFPEKTTFFMATVTSFPTLLSVLQNQIITAYVNPKNLKADAVVGLRTYFSQPEIHARVPGCVIIIALMSFGIQLIGYLLVSNPPNPGQDDEKTYPSSQECNGNAAGSKSKKYGSNVSCENGNSNLCPEKQMDLSSNGQSRNMDEKNDANPKENRISWKPSEVLRCQAFYAVYLFGLISEYGLMLKSSFYKQFGQLYIKNDQYLTLVGTLVPVTSVCSRITFGALVNKNLLSLKDVVVVGLFLNAVLCSFWYFVPKINDLLYMSLILGLAVAHSTYYMVLPASAMRLFGPAHLSTNYALTMSCIIFSSVLTPLIASPIRDAFGWFWLFCSSSFASVLILFLVVLTNFNTQS